MDRQTDRQMLVARARSNRAGCMLNIRKHSYHLLLKYKDLTLNLNTKTNSTCLVPRQTVKPLANETSRVQCAVEDSTMKKLATWLDVRESNVTTLSQMFNKNRETQQAEVILCREHSPPMLLDNKKQPS